MLQQDTREVKLETILSKPDLIGKKTAQADECRATQKGNYSLTKNRERRAKNVPQRFQEFFNSKQQQQPPQKKRLEKVIENGNQKDDDPKHKDKEMPTLRQSKPPIICQSETNIKCDVGVCPLAAIEKVERDDSKQNVPSIAKQPDPKSLSTLETIQLLTRTQNKELQCNDECDINLSEEQIESDYDNFNTHWPDKLKKNRTDSKYRKISDMVRHTFYMTMMNNNQI